MNDTEDNISGILHMCTEAKVYSVICFGMGLTLREGNREYFYEQLDRLFPRLKEKYMQTYGNRYIVESPDSDRLILETCMKDYFITRMILDLEYNVKIRATNLEDKIIFSNVSFRYNDNQDKPKTRWFSKDSARQPIIIPHFSCHVFRHTFCTRFCENERTSR